MRYKFYREHKYVSATLNDLERLIARVDFCDVEAVAEVEKIFDGVAEMLKFHAEYEDEQLHSLLQQKGSEVHTDAEQDHHHQTVQIAAIRELIEQVKQATTAEARIEVGYELYLTYRKFVADNLAHLHVEETEILPELQRLYTDEELQQVEAQTYQKMTPDEMVHMLEVLFPHMNRSDRHAFLADIQRCEPAKFTVAWTRIAPKLVEEEQQELLKLMQ
jgi:hemerythrin-like domain-containing protein